MKECSIKDADFMTDDSKNPQESSRILKNPQESSRILKNPQESRQRGRLEKHLIKPSIKRNEGELKEEMKHRMERR